MPFTYECYDDAGALLYVGVTIDFASRMLQHKYNSAWYRDLAMIRARHFVSAEDAAAREVALLATAAPLHNRDRTGRGTPTWVRRVTSVPQ